MSHLYRRTVRRLGRYPLSVVVEVVVAVVAVVVVDDEGVLKTLVLR
jgi:hypothetical protein